jgi:D-beta-D-heptose 7-phosphate kinase/D-beta-D-heptose 1-phosphate adenosyltransferase
MKKIIRLKDAISVSKKLRHEGKTIVLAGGVFDILHIGHVKFLEKAQQRGDILFVFLESDDNTRKLKGKNRPVNSQKSRAIVLAALTSVNYVILLPNLKTDADYDSVVSQIRPSIIAATAQDPNILHKKRQATQIKGKVVCVLQRISNQSTSKLARLIDQDLL